MGTFTITQQPDSKNVYLYPNANGCDISTFPFGASENYKCVDNTYDSLTVDDDFVYKDGASVVSDLYQMQNHGTLTGSINYVKAYCRAKSEQFPPAHDFIYKIVLSKDSTCTEFDTSHIQPLSTGFVRFGHSWLTNPFNGDADWNWDDIDDLQVGFEMSSPQVTMSPFIFSPAADGDRTDIADVTTGYEHWEAVIADRPLTQISETESAWNYDLYNFLLTDEEYHTNKTYYLNHYGDYLVSTSGASDITFIYEWRTGKTSYLDDIAVGGNEIASDGTRYFLGAYEHIYVLSFDTATNTLNIEQDIELSNAEGCSEIEYRSGYVYAACEGDGLRVYKVVGNQLVLKDNTSYRCLGVAVNNNYVYASSNPEDTLYVYSFDGSSLTLLDSIGITGPQYGLTCDGDNNVYVPDTGNIEAYSFDGTTLTLEDSVGTGTTYSRITRVGKYICVADIGVADHKIYAYSFDGSSLTEEATYTYASATIRNLSSDGDFLFVADEWEGGSVLSFNGTDFDVLHEISDALSSKYLDDNIESVTVILKMGKEYDAPDEADIRGMAIIKTHDTEYTSDYVTLEYPKKWYAFTWETNPNTSSSWTLAEVQDLQAGVGLYGSGTKYASCSVVQLAVAATTSVSPEIHTSQVYMKVNYSPPEESCTLNKPTTLSIDHTRNNNILNFWSGNREVYGINRSGKSLVLEGMEYYNSSCTDPSSRIECIRNFAVSGADVVISDLDMACYNGTYKIRSLGFTLVQKKPEVYKWMIELEDTEL